MLLLRFFIFPLLVSITHGYDAAQEVTQILVRLLGPEKAGRFAVNVDANISADGKDTFTLFKDNSLVLSITGSSGVAAAWGAKYYLTEYCNCHISWDGDQLRLPEVLPNVNVTISSLDKYKYYQNVCTSSYSFVWWDWPRWEREIDWMALSGINLALAFAGQEAIWRRVFDGLGVNPDNFTGPAFLAWGRMGNIRAFGGGLSPAWHARSVSLQHKVLDRMRSLGITPVLPAFSGILPPAFKTKYPTAIGSSIARWNDFPDEYCCPFLLSPSDAFFPVVSRLFLREYISEFGTNHIYNVDTFNENDPDSDDPSYIADTARAIYEGMVEEDPLAVWMVQGWMFLSPFWGTNQVKAYVTGVPLGKMLILDLQSDLTPFYDQFESYYGQPFIWCTLHNFGGQLGMYGHLEKVNNGIPHGRNFAENSTLVGVGITPEGIDQNYIMYDFTLNGNLQETPVNMTEWVSDYIKRRYGGYSSRVDDAWQILKDSAYNYDLERRISKLNSSKYYQPYGNHIAQNILTKRPSLVLSEISWYEKRKVYEAYLLLVEEAASNSGNSDLKRSPLFTHDLVDVTRQVVQLAVGLLYRNMVNQFRDKDAAGLNKTATHLLNLMEDIDLVLSTDKKFLLGPWLEDAKTAGSTSEEKQIFEYNARNQITLWGPSGEIVDYAAKQWSGMMKDYYKPRWEVFIDALRKDIAGETSYNKTAVNELILLSVETPFCFNQSLYPTEPQGDSITEVLKFNATWGILTEIFSDTFLGVLPRVIGPKGSSSFNL